MEMVFNNPDQRWPQAWSARDHAMAETMQDYWINFARTGNPNGEGLPTWPAYTVDGDAIMAFANTGAAPVEQFEKARLDVLEASHTEQKAWTRLP